MTDLDLDEKVSLLCNIFLLGFSLLAVALLFYFLYQEGKIHLPFQSIQSQACQTMTAGSTAMLRSLGGKEGSCNEMI